MNNSSFERHSAPGVDISFVVETVNTPNGDHHLLWQSLTHLSNQSVAANRMEILVVVDPSAHPQLPRLLASEWPDISVVLAPGCHYYAQKNLGARSARGRIVGYVDSDCLAAPDWAEHILELFERRGSEIGGAQGVYSGFDGAQEKAFAIAIFGQCLSDKEEPARALGASNCAFARLQLEEVPFDEAPFFHGPDVRLYSRLAAEGRPIFFCPGALARHRFERGLGLFWSRGLNWGFCFLESRRVATSHVKYARLAGRLGWLAPFAIAPAKAYLDVTRLFRHRSQLRLLPGEAPGAVLALIVHAAAVGVGGLLYKLGRNAPAAPY